MDARNSGAAQSASVKPLRPVEAGPFPLSYQQMGIWYTGKLAGINNAYHISYELTIRGDIDLPSALQAWRRVINRHDALRTVIRESGGIPYAHLLDDVSASIQLCTGNPDAIDNLEWRQSRAEFGRQAFDFENGPLIRAKLFGISERECRLLLVVHHIVFDLWSLELLIKDFRDEYGRLRQGQCPADTGGGSHYYKVMARQDDPYFVDKQADMVERAIGAIQPLPEYLELGQRRGRSAAHKRRGALHKEWLDPSQCGALREFATRERVSIFNVTFSAFTLLLQIYSQRTEFATGTWMHGRQGVADENLVGLMVNTLPIRFAIDGTVSLLQHIKNVQRQLYAAVGYQHAPFNQVVKGLGIARSIDFLPITGIMFNSHVVQLSGDQSGLQIIREEFDTGLCEHELDITLEIAEDAIYFTFCYCLDLYSSAFIAQMAGHYVEILDQMTASPEQSIDRLHLHSNMPPEFLGSVGAPGPDETLDECISIISDNSVKQVAVEDEARAWTYLDLDTQANRLARYLREQGIDEGDVVGVSLIRGFELVVASLAVIKAGCIYLPVDRSTPVGRLKYIVNDSAMSCIITRDSELSTVLNDRRIVDLSQAGDEIEQLSGSRISHRRGPGSPCCLIYTSGSTGVPKGVLLSHRSIINECQWLWREFPPRKNERACLRVRSSFVDAIWEMYGALMHGVALRVVPEPLDIDPANLYRFIVKNKITRVVTVPALLDILLSTAEPVDEDTHAGVLWLVGGEKVEASLVNKFHQALPRHRLVNVYGTTETSGISTFKSFDNNKLYSASVIGTPIDNTFACVLDANGRRVPFDVPGELHVGGAGLFLGYHNDAALTHDRFIDLDCDGKRVRLYRTGDRVLLLEDGTLEYLERVDGQINLRGYRIDASEIESRMNHCPGVGNSVVLLAESESTQRHLVAFYTADAGLPVTNVTIKRELAKYLPQFMIPARLVQIERFPFNTNGKIDRGALLRMQTGTQTGANEPQIENEIERELYLVWRDILPDAGFNTEDDFFEVGGHSLLALQLLQRVVDTFAVDVPLPVFYAHTTIRSLADWIARQQAEPANTVERHLALNHSKAKAGMLVTLRDGGGMTPLYCVPAAASTTVSLRTLASAFTGSQSLVGIEPYGLLKDTEAQSSVEDMAQAYVQAIRAAQPNGPYFLAGRCFGGIVAFEMARQLLDRGITVGLLVLLEAAVPMSGNSPAGGSLQYLRRLSRYPVDWYASVRTRRANAAELKVKLAAAPANLKERIRQVDNAHRYARDHCRLSPIDAPVVVLRSRLSLWAYRSGWDRLTRATYRCVEVEGDEQSMFEPPHAAGLSRTLSDVLTDAGLE